MEEKRRADDKSLEEIRTFMAEIREARAVDLVNQEHLKENITSFMRTLNIHDIVLYGDKTNKKDDVGLIQDVRSLKEIQKNREGHVKVVWIAVCTFIADFINNHFGHWFK